MSDCFTRQCLHCGMLQEVWSEDFFGPRDVVQCCAKCDSELFLQSDDSVLTEDIAHQRQTVSQSLDRLDVLLQEAWQGYFRALRVIVGSGRIREEVLARLHYLYRQQSIRTYGEDGVNRGAVLIELR